ncbi:hypothetical protein PORCRE_141 [Porphyromonas crevioricanis JCM 15906]|uniref:Uncharacterized protein n=1 Tax=Porphyromonas crevioricanis JCM 15906 TaxID=1305617 RepID=S4NFU8_9PORP|nr:hypothetical protein PORCRE_141 [Porphyromonas crevioricanis JCM 15906]
MFPALKGNPDNTAKEAASPNIVVRVSFASNFYKDKIG